MYDGGTGAVSAFNNARASMMQRFQQFRNQIGISQDATFQPKSTGPEKDFSIRPGSDHVDTVKIKKDAWDQMEAKIEDSGIQEPTEGETTVTLQRMPAPETGSVPPQYAEPTVTLQMRSTPETGSVPPQIKPEEE